jgi:hypothetical protein
LLSQLLSFFTLNSCSKDDENDPCKEITCNNGGTAKADGSNCNCECVLGYEGATCATKVVAKYVGNYGGAREECKTSGNSSVAVEITQDSSDVTKANIKNIYNANRTSTAKVNANGELSN